jgi:hypothetical protein
MPWDDGEDEGSSYRAPKLKMKLKETRLEREERRWRKEQRRLRKESKKIFRANGISPVAGMAITPPRASESRDDSISPPRKRSRTVDFEEEHGRNRSHNAAYMQDWDQDAWEPQPSAFKRDAEAARTARDEHEWRQKMFDLMAADEGGPIDLTSGRYCSPPPRTVQSNDLGSTSPIGAGSRIPDRVKRAAGWGSSAPDYANMDDEEYSEAIRYGMWRRRNKDEVERQEQAAETREQEAETKARLKRMQEEEERKRVEVLKRETGKAEQRRRDREIAQYTDKWKALRAGRQKGDEPEYSPAIRLLDLPWPVFIGTETASFHPTMLKPERIETFFHALLQYETVQSPSAETTAKPSAKPTEGDAPTLRKVLRDAILSYHPDRFVGRYLAGVYEPEREMVREAIIRCSQIINELASQTT